MPAQRQQLFTCGARVDARMQFDVPVGDCGGKTSDRVAASGRHRERGVRCVSELLRPWEPREARRRRRSSNRLPRRSATATVRAPATDTCWPTIARTAVSNGSTLAGARRPGTAPTNVAEFGNAAERVVDRGRIGIEVEQPANPLDGGREIDPRLERDACSDVVVVRHAVRRVRHLRGGRAPARTSCRPTIRDQESLARR